MELCAEIQDIIERKKGKILTLSDQIWDLAEVGLTEHKSKAVYEAYLKEEGFEVTTPVDYLPTSFMATYGHGKPVIGITGEYDALPGFSQKANALSKEPSAENPSAGHACGHNLLGAGALTAAVAVKEYLQAHGTSGTVVLLGTPSEERDAGKAFMAKEGVFKDLDVAFTWHPEYKTQVWSSGTLANIIVKFQFTGTPAHAAAAPERGRSALDAAELMNVGVNFLREQIISTARIHYAFTDVGGEAPNVVQPSSSLLYFIRAPKLRDATSIYERVRKIAHGACEMTETTVEEEFQLAVSDFIANKVLSKLMYESATELGAPAYTEDEIKTAQSYYHTLSDAEKESTDQLLKSNFDEETYQAITETCICNHVFPYSETAPVLSGSTDVGDLSYCVPTAQMLVATEALGTTLHSWQMASQGKTSLAKKGMLYAGAIIALSAVKVLTNPEIAAQAQAELARELGPAGYVSPIPADVKVRDTSIE